MESKILDELRNFDEELTLRNYSKSSRKAYGCASKQFLEWRKQTYRDEPLTKLWD